MRFKNSDAMRQNDNVKIITSCCIGEIIPLEQIGNDVFSSLILGEGFGVIPSDNVFVAPADGIVKDISADGRYVTIKTDGGIILIVSLSVTDDGCIKDIDCLRSSGESVSRGSELWKLSCGELSDCSVVAAVVVTNTDAIPSFNIRYGNVRLLDQPVMTITI